MLTALRLHVRSKHFLRNLCFSLLASVLAAHLVVTYNQRYSLLQMLAMRRYYHSLWVNALAALVLIEFVHAVSRRLYRRFSALGLGWRWMLLQLLLGVGVALLLEVLIASLFFYFDGKWILDTVFFAKLFGPIAMFIVILNLFFMLHYLYREPAVVTQVRYRVASSLRSEQLGAEQVLGLPALLYVSDRSCWSIGFDGERLRWPDSLELSHGRLGEVDYFRGQRDWLVHRAAITGVRQLAGKRLQLQTSVDFPFVLVVSRRRAPAFKQWWSGEIGS